MTSNQYNFCSYNYAVITTTMLLQQLCYYNNYVITTTMLLLQQLCYYNNYAVITTTTNQLN